MAMLDHEPFDILPRFLFKRLREQMLLGTVSSETVESILLPVLEDYEELMPLLPPRVQNELDDILRMYPEIAESYGLTPRPAFFAVLDSLWELLKEFLAGEESRLEREPAHACLGEMSMVGAGVGEAQRRLNCRPGSGEWRASACLTTDEGNEVILAVSSREGKDAICFESPGLTGEIEICLCGCPVCTLGPEESTRYLTVLELADMLKGRESSDMDVEVVERKG